MWQSCFTYFEKGLYYIWEVETAEEKEATVDLAARNAEKYEKDFADWLAKRPLTRLQIRDSQIPGVKPQFRHIEANGAFIRKEGKGGIDWYRYQINII